MLLTINVIRVLGRLSPADFNPARRVGRSRRGAVHRCRAAQKRDRDGRLHHAGQLAAALSLDMTSWYAAAAENFFNRVPKPVTLDAIAEARRQPNAIAWTKLKKAELASLAERHVAGTGWLPVPLRAVACDGAESTPIHRPDNA